MNCRPRLCSYLRSSSIQLIGFPGGFARRGANRLRLSNEFSGGHAGSESVLTTQEARHRRCPERRNLAKGGAFHLGLVTQSVDKDLCLGSSFGHS